MAKGIETYRAFIAIELPPNIRDAVAQHIVQLRQELPDVRASWSRDEGLHLTLKFLGDVPVADIPSLCAAAEEAARKVSSFELVVSGCGTFPPHGQPKVLWIGIQDDSGKLRQLHEGLEDECARAGFPREARAFHPHVTVARLRSTKDARALGQLHRNRAFNPQSLSVTELLVFRSELRSEGSRHTVIARHRLL